VLYVGPHILPLVPVVEMPWIARGMGGIEASILVQAGGVAGIDRSTRETDSWCDIHLKRAPRFQPRFLPPVTLPGLEWWTMRFSVVDYCREKHPTFYTRLADNRDGIKRRRPIGRFPVPQTSPSTSSSFRTLDRTLYVTYPIPFSQFSNSQTNSSSTFSLIFPQNCSSPVLMHGSAFSTIWGSMITMSSGWSFYGH